MQMFIKPTEEVLKKVFLFTAYPDWNPKKEARHKNYIRVLTRWGYWVDLILWNFKTTTKNFDQSKNILVDSKWNPTNIKVTPSFFSFQTKEEKQTDVNLWIHLLKGCFLDEYDIAFIVTADTDLTCAIKMCKDLYPEKLFILIQPYRKFSDKIRQECDESADITFDKLDACILPKDIKIWSDVVSCPYPYNKIQHP